MAVSKRLRFEILRRDNHACRYCGAKAPDVALTVDHVVPVALGGTDDPSNLVTACRPCNTGKSSITPDAPLVADVAQDALRWARAMEQATSLWAKDLHRRHTFREHVEAEWKSWGYEVQGERRTFPLPHDWATSVDRIAAAGASLHDFADAIELAMTTPGVKDEWRYMCGVLWARLADRQEVARQILTAEDAVPPGAD
jgi:hypothetical protein